MVALREGAELLQGLELEDVERLLEGDLGVGLFRAFSDLCPDGFRDGVEERAEVLGQRIPVPQQEDLAVISLLNGVVEQQHIRDVLVPQTLRGDGF